MELPASRGASFAQAREPINEPVDFIEAKEEEVFASRKTVITLTEPKILMEEKS